MKTKITRLVALLLALPFIGCSSGQVGNCQDRARALFEIGTNLTKVNFSEVSVCGSSTQVTRVLDDKTLLELNVEPGPDGRLSSETQVRILTGLAQLRDHVQIDAAKAGLKSVEFSAVATESLRAAKNGDELAAKVTAFGIPMKILPPERQGALAFEGMRQVGVPRGCKGRDPVIWELSGGGQTLTESARDGKLSVQGVSFSGSMFKRKLIHDLHTAGTSGKRAKCEVVEPSPNPIGWKNASRAETVAQEMAKDSVPREFSYHPITQCVIGVGDVHTRLIESQLGRYWHQIQSCACDAEMHCTHHEGSYSKKELQCLALWLSEKSDCDKEIKGPLSTTAVSDLFLVLGFMDYLKIDQVETMNLNLVAQLMADSSDLTWTSRPVSSK